MPSSGDDPKAVRSGLAAVRVLELTDCAALGPRKVRLEWKVSLKSCAHHPGQTKKWAIWRTLICLSLFPSISNFPEAEQIAPIQITLAEADQHCGALGVLDSFWKNLV